MPRSAGSIWASGSAYSGTMALTPRLELRQSQSLVMTPQLQQAIKLLQLSSLDLAAFVEQELERNPLLERDEGQSEAAPVPGKISTKAPNSAILRTVPR